MSFPMAWQTAARKPGQVVNGRILPPASPDDLEGRLHTAAAAAPAMGEWPAPGAAADPYNAQLADVTLKPERMHTAYQGQGRGHLGGYMNNPLDAEGRQAAMQQFVHAPLGGHLRSALQGQAIPGFDHTITNKEARMAEQAAAGVLATGIGGWGLLSAIDALQSNNTPQTAGTMAMVG